MKPTAEQQEILSKARRTVQTFFPYFSTLVLRMEHEVSDEMPTAAVFPNGHTVWGNEFLNNLAQTDGTAGVAWVMLHELLHIVMKHGKAAEKLATSETYFPTVGNVAMDIAINQIIREAISGGSGKTTIWTLKEPTNVSPVYETTFDFPPNLRFLDYYRLLMDKAEKDMKSGKAPPTAGQNPGEGCGVRSSGKDKPSDCSGPSNPISSGDMKVEVAACAQKARKQSERNRGTVALGILQVVEDILDPPKVPWEDVLRNRIFHDVARGYGEYVTYTYPNRRQGGLDYACGAMAPRLSSTMTTQPHVGVLADTSGSMLGDLHKVVRESAAIIQELGTPVTFAACDTEVHFCGDVASALEIKAVLKGGGGTAMQSGLEALAKKGCNPIVCITDGYIEMTKRPTTGAQVIWCIVTDYTDAVKHAELEGWGTVIVCKEGPNL